MRKSVVAAILVGLISMLFSLNPPSAQAVSGFSERVGVRIDDLTVSNFSTGRKIVSPFGYTSGLQDIEYVPTIGTNPVGRFLTVLNGSTIKVSKVVNNALTYEQQFTFRDDRSGRIPNSVDDVYPKTSFVHTSGIAYKDIGGVPYVFIHESWGNSTPKYKEQILYKCRVDYANKLLRIEGAMVVTASAANWPVAADGTPFNTVQEISGGVIVGDWIYSIEWSYNSTDTPTTHVFKSNINDATNPGTLRPTHKTYATTAVNQLPYTKNQGIEYVNGRWFVTRNPNGSGVYEIKIREDASGNITGLEYAGEISGERVAEEEGGAAYNGDLIYYYNISAESYPAYRVKLTAQVRNELVELPLLNFVGAQSDYDDLRVYQGEVEIPRVIANGKLKFLASNASQGTTNPYPLYTVYWGNATLGAPTYSQADLDAINAATASGNVTASLANGTYSDDFANAQTLSRSFTVVDMGSTAAPSAWSISSGYLNQTSNIYGPTTNGASYPFERGTHLILNNALVGDWDLSTRVNAGDNDGIGLVFGWQDSQNFYALEWDAQTSELGFWKSVNQTNTGTVIGEVTGYPYVQGTWYTLKVTKRGSTYRAYVDGVLKLTATDSTFGSGKVGLLSRGSINLKYDDFSVFSYSDYADSFSSIQTMANYTVADMGTISGPGAWSVSGGYLNQTGNIYGPTTNGASYPYERGTYLVQNETYTGDWDLSVEVNAGDNDGIGLVFGWQDSQNFYALEWDAQASQLGFWKSVNQTNTGTVIGEVTGYPYSQGTWYTLKVTKRGATYQFYVNGVLKLTASDATFASGRVGLLSRGSINLKFDDLMVVIR
ncbi:MAG TPA: hypothetical protein VNT75_17595 [Symbiobacteriaceae bacterium]|nr:hypothetical protein [Symbiobacteriaceae bacterium]